MINSEDNDRAIEALRRGELPERTDLLVGVLWAWRTSIDNDESHGRSVAAWMGVAGEIAKSPDLIATLLREHRATPDGRLCARCGRAGSGTPWIEWPCALAAVAMVAAKMRADRDA